MLITCGLQDVTFTGLCRSVRTKICYLKIAASTIVNLSLSSTTVTDDLMTSLFVDCNSCVECGEPEVSVGWDVCYNKRFFVVLNVLLICFRTQSLFLCPANNCGLPLCTKKCTKKHQKFHEFFTTTRQRVQGPDVSMCFHNHPSKPACIHLTDFFFVYLGTLCNLRSLDLSFTNITGECLENIHTLKYLQTLILYATPVQRLGNVKRKFDSKR